MPHFAQPPMDPVRFQRASQVFLAARQRDAAEREGFIHGECGDDAGLISDVMRLLGNDSGSDGAVSNGARASGLTMESHALGGAIRAAAEEAFRTSRGGQGESRAPAHDINIGRSIGRYRILRRIGEGGMGAVYLAEQENPRRQVALKIIRPGIVSPSLLRRFELEAQVLGRLQHPGIAQIFEAGAHDSGDGAQPYFAMEFVDGLALTAFAEMQQLNVRDRLELLARIADAVEHAHQRGVIHRDLKPGNILVGNETRRDEETERRRDEVELRPSSASTASLRLSVSLSLSQPKILDFGVARAIDSDVQAATMQTAVGQIIGTVAYMSPEQASGKADDIDTRSDVYALGVIGYELLAQKQPHDLSKRTVPEALRTITENEPTRLGIVRRELQGDIETIIAHAMEKDRARRYQSAAELAADIRRYLRDEPILARPASTIYQLRKFARRNKALVGGLAAVFIVLVAGIVGTSIGMKRAMGEARKAQRMNEYLRGMILFLDPSVTKSNQITLRDVLDDASRRVDAELHAEPDVAAEILITIASGYNNIAAYDLAATHGLKAIALLESCRDSDDAIFAAVWDLVGLAHFRANQPVEAEDAYRKALALNRSQLGDAHPDTLGNIRDIIHLLEIQGTRDDMDELVAIAANAEEMLPATSDEERVGLALEAIADILSTQHRMAEAEPLYMRAIEVLGRVKGSRYAIEQCIVCTRNLSFILEMQSRLAEAMEFDRRAVEMSMAAFGPEHEVTLVSLQGWLRMLRANGELAAAEDVALQVAGVTAKMYGEDSRDHCQIINNLALIMRERGRSAESLPLFEQALTLRRKYFEPDSLDLSRTLGGMGMALVDCDRGAEAVPLLRESQAIRLKTLGPEHSSMPVMNTVLAAALVQAREFPEAERLLLEALPRLHSTSTARTDAFDWLVKLYEAWGKPDEAAKYKANAETSKR